MTYLFIIFLSQIIMMVATIHDLGIKEIGVIKETDSIFEEDYLGGFPLYLAKFSLTIGLTIQIFKYF